MIKALVYDKNDGQNPTHPAFFWYDNDKYLTNTFFASCNSIIDGNELLGTNSSNEMH